MLTNNLVLVLLITSSEASRLSDIFPAGGLSLGNGLVYHLQDTNSENSSLFDRLAMRVDYGDIGVSAVQKPEKEAVQLDFFVKDQGRSQKMGGLLLPFMVGALKGSALTMVISTVKLMVMKSLLVTKVALIVSAALLLSKFLRKKEPAPAYLEIEDHFPTIEQEGYTNAASYSTLSFDNVPHGGAFPVSASGSAFSYAAAVAPSVVGPSVPQLLPAAKRRGTVKRKVVPAVLKVKKYVRTTGGGD